MELELQLEDVVKARRAKLPKIGTLKHAALHASFVTLQVQRLPNCPAHQFAIISKEELKRLCKVDGGLNNLPRECWHLDKDLVLWIGCAEFMENVKKKRGVPDHIQLVD